MYMNEQINKQFDDFQKYLETKDKKRKYFTRIEVSDDFYKLIDEISGSNLSDERNRRDKNTNSK